MLQRAPRRTWRSPSADTGRPHVLIGPSRAALQAAAAVLACGMAVSALAGCSGTAPLQHRTRDYQVGGPVRALVVHGHVGGIQVTGGDVGAVSVTERISFRDTPPVTTRRVTGGILTLDSSCPARDGCTVGYDIKLPKATPVNVSDNVGTIALHRCRQHRSGIGLRARRGHRPRRADPRPGRVFTACRRTRVRRPDRHDVLGGARHPYRGQHRRLGRLARAGRRLLPGACQHQDRQYPGDRSIQPVVAARDHGYGHDRFGHRRTGAVIRCRGAGSPGHPGHDGTRHWREGPVPP